MNQGSANMRTINWLLCFVALLLVSKGAVAQDVRYNFDKDTNFSTFKTYKWVDLKDAAKLDSLRDKEIKDSVDAELAKKGLTRTDSDPADLYIGYQAGIGTEKQFTSYDTGWGYGPGWGGGWYGGGGGGMTTGQTSTIYTGQLVIDMYDSKHHDLVWRGLVTKTIDPDAKPDKQEKNLNKAVAKLFKNYPPESKEKD
jgi:Domain of unknown function (DUF4136)